MAHTGIEERRYSTREWKLFALIGSLVIVGATLYAASPSSGRSATVARADTFAAIQFTPVNHQLGLNRERLTKLIVEARERGARYIVTPELALVGALPHQSSPNVEPIPGPTTDYFSKYAKKLGIWLVVSVPEKASVNSDYFLTTILLNDRGDIVNKYRKLMVREDQEHAGVSRGNYRDIVDSFDDRGLRVGIMSGDDIRVGVPRLAERGADTILVSAGWTERDSDQWDQLCRSLSKQYSVNLVVANRVESEDVAANKLGGIYSRDGRAFLPEEKNGTDLVLAALPKRKAGWLMESSLGLPSVPLPSVERPSYEIAELGRQLFFDPNLSSTGKISCSSCHDPDKAFANGEAKGTGVHDRKTRRNVPSLLNIAYRPLMRWDGYASSIENFMKYPINGVTEMDFHYLDKVPAYVRSQPRYMNVFRASMGVEEIEFEHVARALAAYQRTLISGNSAFDRYYYGKDKSALSKQAQWGLKLFTGKAECAKCHTIGTDYSHFMDLKYHDVGVSFDLVKKEYDDRGLGEISTDDSSGLFLTPSLRNVALTAPYMHDGSMKTLDEVVEYFNRGGKRGPHVDPLMKPLGLTVEERKAIVAFLESLTGDQRYSSTGQRLNQQSLANGKR